MFAAFPFATAPFASLGSTGPVYVSTTMLAVGNAEFDPRAQWYQTAAIAAVGDSTFTPYFQLLRDSGFGNVGIAEFNIHSMWNLTSTLEAKGYGEASFGFQYFYTTKVEFLGEANTQFDSGFKILVEALMKGSSEFKPVGSAMFDSAAYYDGLSDMFAYTAY